MTLQLFLLFGLALFCLGLFAIVARRHLIGILIGIELMLNAASINLLALSHFGAVNATTSQIIVLFIIGLAAAEAAIALSIIVALHRARQSVNVDQLKELRG